MMKVAYARFEPVIKRFAKRERPVGAEVVQPAQKVLTVEGDSAIT